MKTAALLYIGLLTFLFSCSKNNEKITTTADPVVDEMVIFKGTVTNARGEAVAKASIKIYDKLDFWANGEAAVDSVMTDMEGKFELSMEVHTTEHFIWVEKEDQNNWPVNELYDERLMGEKGLQPIFKETAISTLLRRGKTIVKDISIRRNNYAKLANTKWIRKKTFNGWSGKYTSCDTVCSEIELTRDLRFIYKSYVSGVSCINGYRAMTTELPAALLAGVHGAFVPGGTYYQHWKSGMCIPASHQLFYLNYDYSELTVPLDWESSIKNYYQYAVYERQ